MLSIRGKIKRENRIAVHVVELADEFAIGHVPQLDFAASSGFPAAGRQSVSVGAELDGVDAVAQRRVNVTRSDDAFEAPPRKYAVGAVFLRGQGTGRVTAIRGVDEVNREIGGLVVESKLPQPGQAPSGGYEGEGYVILRHPETDVVEKALGRLLTTLRVELG